MRRRIRAGEKGLVPSVEEALRELGPAALEPRVDDGTLPSLFIGSPETLRRQLTVMADQWHLDEIMVVTIMHDHHARMRSHELLAGAFELG